MKYKAVTVGCVLAVTALGSNALNLGKARGAAWIGQPLELVVPVQVEPGQADSGLCAEADVFHGDSRQEASRVQVQQSPGEQPDTVNLKITSSALIDEPVVSVYLRAGCGQKSSRKFVLLADFPNGVSAAAHRVATPTALQTPSAAPQEAPSSEPSGANTADGSAIHSTPVASKPAKRFKRSARVAKGVAREVDKQAENHAASKSQDPHRPAPASRQSKLEGMPRLRLDPLEEFGDRIRTLEAANAAANLQDNIARDSQKLQALESDSRRLLDQAAKNEAALAAIRTRLEKTQGDGVPVTVFYGLGALVALALGAVAFLWNQRARHGAWRSAEPRTTGFSAKETGVDLDLS